MIRCYPFIVAALTFVSSAAWAGEVRVATSDGTPITVLMDGAVLGVTPVLANIASGRHELAFRTAAFGPTAFTLAIDVDDVPLAVQIDWQNQTAATQPVVPQAAPPAPGAAPPAAAVTSTPAPGTGDVYVTSAPAGAPIFLDHQPTGLVTPAMLPAVPRGKHVVDVQTACERASVEVNVKEALVTRAELIPQVGTGAARVTSEPSGALVLLDGKEVGRTPLTLPQVACTEHDWSVRLAGYLAADGRTMFPAFKTTDLVATLQKERFGVLVLVPDPLDATLALDGIALGAGPRTVERVGVGPHTVQGAQEGRVTTDLPIEVAPDVVTRIEVVLPPVPPPAEPVKKGRRSQTRALRTDNHRGDTPPPPPVPPPLVAPNEPAHAASRTVPVVRVVMNGVTTGAALVTLGVAVPYWLASRDWYKTYLSVPDRTEGERVYFQQVMPRRNAAIACTVVGSALAVTAGALWGTTKFKVLPTTNGVVIGGQF